MLYIKIGVIALVLALTYYGGYKTKSLLVESAENKELKEAIKAKDKLQLKYDALSTKVLEAVGKNTVVNTRTTEKTYREVEKPVYESCVIPASGVEIQNEQVEGLNPQIRGPIQ